MRCFRTLAPRRHMPYGTTRLSTLCLPLLYLQSAQRKYSSTGLWGAVLKMYCTVIQLEMLAGRRIASRRAYTEIVSWKGKPVLLCCCVLSLLIGITATRTPFLA